MTEPAADPISTFCAFHHAYNHISPARALDQERLLRRLEASLCGTWAEMGSQDLENFLVSQGVAASTMLKYLKMIRPFLKWAYRRKVISAEQLLDLQEVRAPRGASWSSPKPYTPGEIKEFWEHLDATFPWTTDQDLREQTTRRAEFWVRRWQRGASHWYRVYPYARRLQVEAIVALALFGGLRRIEIFNLELEDMHYENRYVRVTGAAKNPAGENVIRPVPMTDQMKLALSNWIEFRAQVLAPEHDRPWLNLFREQRLQPMSFSVLAHLFDKVGDGYELHRFRHTFATERLRAKMPVEKLQPIMGHTNIQQTLRYTRISLEDLIEASDQTNDAFAEAMKRDHTTLEEVTDVGR